MPHDSDQSLTMSPVAPRPGDMVDLATIQPLKIAPLHFSVSDGRPQHLADKWAEVDSNGKVKHLDMDRARAMAATTPGSPFYGEQIPRAIAALVVEAFDRGRAAANASAPAPVGDGYDWRGSRDAA